MTAADGAATDAGAASRRRPTANPHSYSQRAFRRRAADADAAAAHTGGGPQRRLGRSESPVTRLALAAHTCVPRFSLQRPQIRRSHRANAAPPPAKASRKQQANLPGVRTTPPDLISRRGCARHGPFLPPRGRRLRVISSKRGTRPHRERVMLADGAPAERAVSSAPLRDCRRSDPGAAGTLAGPLCSIYAVGRRTPPCCYTCVRSAHDAVHVTPRTAISRLSSWTGTRGSGQQQPLFQQPAAAVHSASLRSLPFCLAQCEQRIWGRANDGAWERSAWVPAVSRGQG
jgi:hypothetical protein